MYLSEDECSEENIAFMNEENIEFFHVKIQGNKEPFVEIDQAVLAQALCKLLDKRNHPILVHCNKGKHRVGCLIGVLRKFQKWSLASIFDEYRRFSGQKLRIMDQEFIEIFDYPINLDQNYAPSWI